MVQPRTPDLILEEIAKLRYELMRAPEALHDTELAAERAAEASKLAEDKVFMTAEGSIPERQAQARLQTPEVRDEAFIAKAAHTRVKSKQKVIEVSLMTLQSELRFVRDETT